MIRILLFSLLFVFSGFDGAYATGETCKVEQVLAKKTDTFLKAKPKKTVCLNMIVKDESPVIRRCLASVKKFIDYWVIVDTGSKDGTQELIKEFMKDIPGNLYERPWKNFAHNRNEALDLAKGCGDYVLFIDADEVFVTPENYSFPELTEDGYLAAYKTSEDGNLQFPRWLLLTNHLDLRWKGVLHEQLACSKAIPGQLLPNILISAVTKDGHRTQDPNKDIKDALVLEEGLKSEPDNPDYVFYLAQCYFSAKEYSLALKNYLRRAAMGGWEEEVFFAKYQSGVLQEVLGMKDLCAKSYCDAYHYRPTRAEPLFRLSSYYYEKGNYLIAYVIAKLGTTIKLPADRICYDRWIYDFGFLYLIGKTAFKLGKTEDSIEALEKLLLCKTLPDDVRNEAKSGLVQLKTESFLRKKQ